MADSNGDGSILDRALDRSRKRVEFNPAEMGVAPLALQVLLADEPTPCDLYLPILNNETKKVEMTLAVAAGDTFQARWRDRLVKTGQERVFVPVEEGEALHEYFQEHAAAILDAPDATIKKRSMVVREMATLNLRVLFGGDMSPRALDGAVGSAQETVTYMARNPLILTNLSEVLKSDYTVYTHSVNVSMVAMAFGKYLGLTDGQVNSLGMGGLLHDVGMSRLPRALLEKRGRFTPDERKMMNRHPRSGYKALLPIGAVPYDVLMITLHHHENADGTGYPDRLPAERTPRLARITKVCDAFDAMTSQRPYQDARPPYEAATTLIQDSHGQFGNDLVPHFIRFLGSPSFSGKS